MFTGIVECIGVVESLRASDRSLRLCLKAPFVAPEVQIGDSVAINGACLTASLARGESLCFDAVRETTDRTNLGALEVGSRVNLERALRAGGRLDGHIVQGHVDGVGSVSRLSRQGDDVRLFIACERELAALLVDKGSVTIDGVSLTVVRAQADGFDVVLIPHTLEVTTLGDRKPGDVVNLEADILGKYVKRYLERTAAGQS